MPNACYVYAITARHTPLPTTVDSRALELAMVPRNDLSAVIARRADHAASVTMEAVLHHESVVEAVRRQGLALPVRFGTVFRDETSVADALAARYESLAIDLERLGDKVEMGLTALWAVAPSVDERTVKATAERSGGARYLHARAAELRQSEALREKAQGVALVLERSLGALAIDRRISLQPTPRIAVRATFLLDPTTVSAFQSAFETTRRGASELRALLTGPWPPYTFVRHAEAADGRLGRIAQWMTEAMH